MMAICPYCKNEMKDGYVECDGRQSLIWVENNQKRNFIDNMTDENCIVLEESNLLHKIRVKASFCEVCKKIIISKLKCT